MPDGLHIGKVSKPVLSPSVTYDVNCVHIIPANAPEDIPVPIYPMEETELDLLGGGDRFVCALGSAQLASNKIAIINTDCEISGGSSFWFADWDKPTDDRDPHCDWRIRGMLSSRGWDGIMPDGENPDNKTTIIDMPYGLLPSGYTASKYGLVSIDKLIMHIESPWAMLYIDTGSMIAPSEAAYLCSKNGVIAEIEYQATLHHKEEPYETITVEGVSTSYTPFYPMISGLATVCYTHKWQPLSLTEKKGTVTMTETPVT